MANDGIQGAVSLKRTRMDIGNISRIRKYFPSYAGIPDNKNLLIEHILKYGNIDEIKNLFTSYGFDLCKKVWEKNVLSDSRLMKLNYFLAKYFFNLSVDENELKLYINSHTEKRSDRISNVFNQ